jgi:hypothetical protein
MLHTILLTELTALVASKTDLYLGNLARTRWTQFSEIQKMLFF